MKRHNNLFDKIVDKDNLLLAYKKAKKHKSWQQKVIRVEKDLDNLIEELRLSLINGTYKTAEYRTKKIYEPKERTIYVLPFYPDRIVMLVEMVKVNIKEVKNVWNLFAKISIV